MAEFSSQVVMMTLQLFPMCFNVFVHLNSITFSRGKQAFLIHSEEEHGFISEQKVGLCIGGCRLLQ
jgi:hypothetical protein